MMMILLRNSINAIIIRNPVVTLSSLVTTRPKIIITTQCCCSGVHHHRSSSRLFHTSRYHGRKMNLDDLIEKVNIENQPVLVRVDLNVPLDNDNNVTDDTRLRAILPTTKFLLEHNAKVILCSHFGRPNGKIIETGKNGRLTPVQKPLQDLLQTDVIKVNDCIGPEVEQAVQNLQSGKQVLLLENTRFHVGETKNDIELSKQLGKLAKYYVNDAFGTAHRAHASTVGVTQYMKYNVAGRCMEKELHFLMNAINKDKDNDDDDKKLIAIIGGAKVSTKLPVINNLIDKCDIILLGGGMIFTFYKALGYDIGNSIVENDYKELAKTLIEKAKKQNNVQLVLPTDVILADTFDNNDATTAIANITDISGNWYGLDIGPQTIQTYKNIIIENCNNNNHTTTTIVWNGPMGVFEMSNFATGTNEIANIIANVTTTNNNNNNNVISIIGGGDSVAAINNQKAKLANKITHISTGGGASLELLEGKLLPGIDALTDVLKKEEEEI